jgi:hypothetical protein
MQSFSAFAKSDYVAFQRHRAYENSRCSVDSFTDVLNPSTYPFIVATKYYTHFVTGASPAAAAANSNEWSGVVELRHPLENVRGTRELRSLLAQSFDLDSDDIKILHWARLH